MAERATLSRMPSGAYVYEATNLKNGKRYVGATSQKPERRWRTHVRDARRGSRLAFHCAIRKHGEESFRFEVVVWVAEPTAAFDIERDFVQATKPAYNMTEGGGGCLGFKRSAESIAKTAAGLRGRHLAEGTKEKLRLANLGKKQAPELVARRTAKTRGLKRTPETIERMRIARVGFRHSDEAKAKISAASSRRSGMKYRPRPPCADETRVKLSAAAKRGNSIQYAQANANSAEAIAKRAAKTRGMKRSEETLEKMRAAWVRRKARDGGSL